MQNTAPYPKFVKALIAPARYSDGPTLFSIFEVDPAGRCQVYEQQQDGEKVWLEVFPGRCQAEAAIYCQDRPLGP